MTIVHAVHVIDGVDRALGLAMSAPNRLGFDHNRHRHTARKNRSNPENECRPNDVIARRSAATCRFREATCLRRKAGHAASRPPYRTARTPSPLPPRIQIQMRLRVGVIRGGGGDRSPTSRAAQSKFAFSMIMSRSAERNPAARRKAKALAPKADAAATDGVGRAPRGPPPSTHHTLQDAALMRCSQPR
jgi:hypothetical protein